MNVEDIERLLPHRHPFRMVDRIDELEPGVRARGAKLVSADEPWAAGHFPGHPVMPGVLIAEALAQVGGIVALTAHPEQAGKPIYLLGFDKIRFRRPVRPGDELVLDVKVTDVRRRMWFFDGLATVGGERVADGVFLATMPEEPPSAPTSG